MNNTFKILVIEDSKPDFVLLKKALDNANIENMEIFHVKDGQEGIDYIFKQGDFNDVKTPNIIVLDLNLPVKNGFEVLECLKTDETYKLIPIIIYSTSDDIGDINTSYSLYANSYITKTFDVEELFEKIKVFSDFWIKSTKMPNIK